MRKKRASGCLACLNVSGKVRGGLFAALIPKSTALFLILGLFDLHSETQQYSSILTKLVEKLLAGEWRPQVGPVVA